MNKKQLFIGITAIVIGVMLGTFIAPLISADNIFMQTRKISEIMSNASKNYFEDVDTEKMTEAAIKSMLNELDPHSVYISKDDMKEVEEDFSGKFEGIGVQFDIINDTITIITPIAGGPSDKVGILSGDKIVKIDGKDAVGIDRNEVPKKLKGPKNTFVKVEIKRNYSKDLLVFDIERDIIPLYTVDASFMYGNTDVGVIRVNRFAEKTMDEFYTAVSKLKSEGMKKLVLDLRGNPGGYLQQAFMMVNQFLKGGDTIVYTKGRREEFNELYTSDGSGSLINLPVIVMVNAGSASASEIVSGAMQDLDRGLVVGETSFGKGLVQRQYPLGDGSAYRLTIARYYTPSGRCIQRPFKDKSNYRKLVGRIEMQEGSNIEHALAKVKKDIEEENAKELKKDPKSKNIINLDSLPVYRTKGGRLVLGGGGIIPDYIVKNDTLTDFSVDLRIKRVFNEFVANYLNNGADVKKQYKDNFKQFKNEFKLNNEQFEKFKTFCISKGVKWNDDDYKKDKDFINLEIISTIASMVWDSQRRTELYYDIDKQFLQAVKLFPEAIKIANLKK